MKSFHAFLRTKGETRVAHLIPHTELDKFIANYLLSITNGNDEYEPDSLTSKFNSISRHLRENKYSLDLKTALEFDHSRTVLTAKRKQLKGQGKGNRKRKAESIEDKELSLLKEKGMLVLGM